MDVKDKIRKLLAVAHDGRGNETETETALRMAEALMRKHGIEQGEIFAATGTMQYDWTTHFVPANPRVRSTATVSWLGQLALGIARYTDTIVHWVHRDGDLGLMFKGEAVDVDFSVWLAESLRDATRTLSATFPGDRTAREDFRRAFVARVIQRMQNARRERTEAYAAHGTALVAVSDKLARRNEEFGEQTTRNTASRSQINASAYASGIAAGNRANINRPIGGENAKAYLTDF